jgi:ABC-type uncharacterized transport system substrate-binding protein
MTPTLVSPRFADSIRASSAILANITSPNSVLEMAEARAAAGTVGLAVVTSEVRGVEDIAPAFDALKGGADALYVSGPPL